MNNIYDKTKEEIALLILENQEKQVDKYIIKNRGFVTASKLKTFRTNPEEYFLKYILEMPGKKETDEDESVSMKLWSAVDSYISDWPDWFNQKYFMQDKKMLKKDRLELCDEMLIETTWENVNELKALATEWRILITPAESKKVNGMLAEYKRQPLFNSTGKYETQKILEYEYKGLKLKATLDRLMVDVEGKDEGELRDMKTTKDLIKFNFLAIDYGYDFSMSFYNIMATAIYEKNFTLILDAVKNSFPFPSQCIKMPAETVVKQWKEQIIPILNKLADMQKNWEETQDQKIWIEKTLEKVDNDWTDAIRTNFFDCEMYWKMETTIQKHFTYLQ